MVLMYLVFFWLLLCKYKTHPDKNKCMIIIIVNHEWNPFSVLLVRYFVTVFKWRHVCKPRSQVIRQEESKENRKKRSCNVDMWTLICLGICCILLIVCTHCRDRHVLGNKLKNFQIMTALQNGLRPKINVFSNKESWPGSICTYNLTLQQICPYLIPKIIAIKCVVVRYA